MAYRFENENGDVIEVETEVAANDYRTRAGFTELDESSKGSRKTRKSAASGDES